MIPQIEISQKISDKYSCAFILEGLEKVEIEDFHDSKKEYLEPILKKEGNAIIHTFPNFQFFHLVKTEKEIHIQIENARKAGSKLFDHLKSGKIETVQVKADIGPEFCLAMLEGLLLSAYRFEKYKKEKDNFDLKKIILVDVRVNQEKVEEIGNLAEAVFITRDLVNEPLSYLTADQLSKEIENLSEQAGFTLEVFHKQKIESLKMGGLLAVNKGSIDPPTFNILEWKPEQPRNEKPIVLVGKGIVYDTGGLSLKPTPKSMDYMKSDMAGAASVIGAFYALAKNKVPFHVIGLIPATDNRPDGNAYAPGDIITMFDGTTVEVRNTDAEGRLILADALSYAKKYDPELVIDIATLTGSAAITAGNQAIAGMGNNNDYLKKLMEVGDRSYERIIELPLWEEFAQGLKSGIADLNNLGGREGQTSIAGKFLEHFTNYNWIHLDSAAVAYRFEKEAYLPVGGTGFGTRLLYNFIKDFN